MGKTSVCVVLLVVVLLSSSFLGVAKPETSLSSMPQAKSALRDVSLNKSIFVRGDAFNLTICAQETPVHVLIYSPEKLFLNYSQAANSSRILTVDKGWVFGFWNVTCVCEGRSVCVPFTVLNDGDYKPEPLPYAKVHLGTSYVMNSSGVAATTMSTGDSMFVGYPLIASAQQKTVGAQSNNMSLQVSMQSGKDVIVVVYAFVHCGVELVVNGSVERAGAFDFQVSGVGERCVDSFVSGCLVFDWSDVVSSGLCASWSAEANVLSVEVNKFFLIDPYLFSDGFESGDFSSWTRVSGNPQIVSHTKYDGSYSAYFEQYSYDVSCISKNYMYLDGKYVRFYLNVEDINSDIYLFSFVNEAWDEDDAFVISKSGNNYYWRWWYLYPSFNYLDSNFDTGEWFCVEIFVQQSTGTVKLWLRGDLVVDISGASFDVNLRCLTLGSDYCSGLYNSYYIDGVRVSDTYIGPEQPSYIAMEYGHLNNGIYPPDPDEVYWESLVCEQIDSYFPSSWGHQNAYWTDTTQTNVLQTLQYIQNPDNHITWATTWWVGDYHGGSSPYTPPPYGHYYFYGDDGSYNDILDTDIWQYSNHYHYFNPPYYDYWVSEPSKQYFTFIWTCANGGCYWNDPSGGWQPTIPGVTWPDTNYNSSVEPPYIPTNPKTVYGYFDTAYGTGELGMPLAWTGNSEMCLDGITDPSGSYCYIGFENSSPFLKNTPTPGWTSTGFQYGYFSNYFYRYALGHDNGGVHATIKQSLDYAAWKTFGYRYGLPYNFENSVLNQGYWDYNNGWWYCKMRVFGNSSILLP